MALSDKFTAIVDVIRAKTGGSETYKLDEMAAANVFEQVPRKYWARIEEALNE